MRVALYARVSTQEQAQNRAIEIIKTFDWSHINFILPVGHWGPITTEEAACETTDEIKIDEDQNAEAAELMEHHKQLSKEKEEREIEEIHKQTEALQSDVKPKTEKELHVEASSLDTYIETYTTKMALKNHLENWHKTKREMQHKLRAATVKLEKLAAKNPGYVEQCIKKLREAKARAGIVGTDDDDLGFGR